MKPSVLFAVLLTVAAGAGALTLAPVVQAMSGRPSTDNVSTHDRDQCFDPKFMRGFQTVDDNKLIITSDSNQAYELRLAGPCIGLDTTYMIGIRSRDPLSEICGPFDAEILYNDMGPRSLQRCQIVAMRHLQGAEADKYIETRQSKRQASSSSR